MKTALVPQIKEEGRTCPAIIPQMSEMLFAKIAALAQDGRSSAVVSVSFLEVYRNTIRDLLGTSPKTSQVIIRERAGTKIKVQGLRQVVVSSPKLLEACLLRGVTARATAATNLNEHSSRSHAIFTVNLKVRRWRKLGLTNNDCLEEDCSSEAAGGKREGVEESLTAKMHIVDLAGSERLCKQTAQAQQRTESASINLGLLSLRNCIEALCRPNHGHVPYRSHKLTRLLQDSLGGNAHTTMIACVSPADSSMEETINTLKYTSSARNIQNKVVVNRDEQSSVVLAMMDEIHVLREQLAAVRSVSQAGSDLLEESKMVADSLVIETLLEDRNSWRMRATAAESRCRELHKEVVALKRSHDTGGSTTSPTSSRLNSPGHGSFSFSGASACSSSLTGAVGSLPYSPTLPSTMTAEECHPRRAPSSRAQLIPGPTLGAAPPPGPAASPSHVPTFTPATSPAARQQPREAGKQSFFGKLFRCVSMPAGHAGEGLQYLDGTGKAEGESNSPQ